MKRIVFILVTIWLTLLTFSVGSASAFVVQPISGQDCSGLETLTPPRLLSPENGSSLSTLAPIMRWEVDEEMVREGMAFRFRLTTYFDGGGTAIRDYDYSYRVGDDPIGEYHFIHNLASNTRYSWEAVLYCYVNGNSSPSTNRHFFQTASEFELLPAPTLIAPDDGAFVRRGPVRLSWESVEGASGYIVRYGRFPDIVRGTYVEGTELILDLQQTPVMYGRFDWTVAARNEHGYGDAPPVRHLTIARYSVYLPAISTTFAPPPGLRFPIPEVPPPD